MTKTITLAGETVESADGGSWDWRGYAITRDGGIWVCAAHAGDRPVYAVGSTPRQAVARCASDLLDECARAEKSLAEARMAANTVLEALK